LQDWQGSDEGVKNPSFQIILTTPLKPGIPTVLRDQLNSRFTAIQLDTLHNPLAIKKAAVLTNIEVKQKFFSLGVPPYIKNHC